MERPTGVIILAVLNFLGALLCVLGALLFFLGLGLMGAGAKATGAGTGPAAMLMGLGAVGGVVFLVFAALAVVVGIGLLKLSNWARILTIILTSISLVLGLLGLVTSLLHFVVVTFVFQLIFLAIYAWILWYMFRPHVKQAFGVT